MPTELNRLSSDQAREMRNPDLLAVEMDGDLVMMSIERGEYYGVGEVGTRIWELIERPQTLAELVAALCSEFEIGEAQCRSDIVAFLGELESNGLVVVD
ncbi:MAG: lasso peptide biosynthesis PqqD family chaperone [Sphingomonadaceae bacterium]|nr:lasso peptide biosynthesis PqqD family chaperone [Sphingomonadaceae bacterium]